MMSLRKELGQCQGSRKGGVRGRLLHFLLSGWISSKHFFPRVTLFEIQILWGESLTGLARVLCLTLGWAGEGTWLSQEDCPLGVWKAVPRGKWGGKLEEEMDAGQTPTGHPTHPALTDVQALSITLTVLFTTLCSNLRSIKNDYSKVSEGLWNKIRSSADIPA